MAIGYMIFQARTAHDALPISGVQVKILGPFGNVVYNLVTDENGETQTVPLETLDKDFANNENYSGIPYVAYNVLAQAEGFDVLYISEIPV